MSCNIAVVASHALGDGLIMLVFAHNLQQQGHTITFYNNFVAQLQNWVPNITVKPYPNKDGVKAEFANYDMVISDMVSVITNGVSKQIYPQLAQDYVFISLSQPFQTLVADHTQKIMALQKSPIETKQLIDIAKCCGIKVSQFDRTQPMARNIAVMCERAIGIKTATNQNGLTPPANLIFKKYPRRVVIHPLSSNAVKDWSAKKFMRLAHLLQRQQWEPVFIVSPREQAYWRQVTNNQFAAPIFANIDELAGFIYESGMMIGNDSGIGHLASNLGISTLTIIRKRDKFYRWRPGWANGKVVMPVITFRIFGEHYWRPFLSVRRVMSAFKLLLKS